MTLYPDADTPFQDELDVVNRLLPYHIFQHPQQDLTVLRGGVGKNKETDVEQLRKEVKGLDHLQRVHNISKVTYNF